MTKSQDETKTPHAPGSQPSTRPGSGEPQTITAPTPPVAWTTGPPDQDDVADGEHTAEPSATAGEPEKTPDS